MGPHFCRDNGAESKMHRSAERSSENENVLTNEDRDRLIVSDTIAAISTPAGEGAIALVRMSGANAIAVADKIFRGKEKPGRFVSHMQHLGEIVDDHGQMIDQVVMSIHRSPSSYTG